MNWPPDRSTGILLMTTRADLGMQDM